MTYNKMNNRYFCELFSLESVIDIKLIKNY